MDLKLETELEENMLMFIWENCLPVKLTNFVSSKYNYDTLTKNNLKFKDVYFIVQEYMLMSSASDDNYNETRKMLKSNFDEIRYVFSTLFSKIYSRTNEDGRQIKAKFDYNFSSWFNSIYSNNNNNSTTNKHISSSSSNSNGTGKNMNDYKNRVFINEFEQKPLKNDLMDVIEVLEQHDEEITKNDTEVKKEEEINSFVKIKPMNDVKKNFLNEREQRKHAKLMKKKKDLEEQLKRNTEQWNLLKPVFKTNERKLKKKLITK